VCVPLALVHSALASREAKELATRLAGRRRRNGLYRMAYMAQSMLTFAWLYRWLRSIPDRSLYDLNGPASWLRRGGQAVAFGAGPPPARARRSRRSMPALVLRLDRAIRTRRWAVVGIWAALVLAALPFAVRQTAHLTGNGFTVPGSQSAVIRPTVSSEFGRAL